MSVRVSLVSLSFRDRVRVKVRVPGAIIDSQANFVIGDAG